MVVFRSESTSVSWSALTLAGDATRNRTLWFYSKWQCIYYCTDCYVVCIQQHIIWFSQKPEQKGILAKIMSCPNIVVQYFFILEYQKRKWEVWWQHSSSSNIEQWTRSNSSLIRNKVISAWKTKLWEINAVCEAARSFPLNPHDSIPFPDWRFWNRYRALIGQIWSTAALRSIQKCMRFPAAVWLWAQRVYKVYTAALQLGNYSFILFVHIEIWI